MSHIQCKFAVERVHDRLLKDNRKKRKLLCSRCILNFEVYLMCRVWQVLGAHDIVFKVNDMQQFWLKSGLDPKLWW